MNIKSDMTWPTKKIILGTKDFLEKKNSSLGPDNLVGVMLENKLFLLFVRI